MTLHLDERGGTPSRPVVLCILDGVGWGRRDDTDAVAVAHTPALDTLLATGPNRLLRAHGFAVGLASEADMGNSEVGHNAMGAGRIIDQGAKLIDAAIATGDIFRGEAWQRAISGGTLHLLGLVSDGNVHAHVKHLHVLIRQAVSAGVRRIRVHALTDGRDVSERSALRWIIPLEEDLSRYPDACIASGGGRMVVTMDRYGADWSMVDRGWRCHVEGEGRRFSDATTAITTLYAEDPDVNDQWLPAFVIERNGEPAGRMENGDAVILFNFRGDRAIEITRAFEDEEFLVFARHRRPDVRFAGMMQYDGDLKLPRHFLVAPPVIDRTVGHYLAANGRRTFAIAETQKFGHVTYFFNGNRSGTLDASLERYEEIQSDRIPFDEAPAMKAREVTARACQVIRNGGFDHIRINLANGDMVGHTGNFSATVQAIEVVDECVAELVAACRAGNAILLVTADHGNADEMFELDKSGRPIVENTKTKVRTSHTLNPVPFLLMDPEARWTLADVPDAGIANIGGTVLHLAGLSLPEGYLPSLVTHVG